MSVNERHSNADTLRFDIKQKQSPSQTPPKKKDGNIDHPQKKNSLTNTLLSNISYKQSTQERNSLNQTHSSQKNQQIPPLTKNFSNSLLQQPYKDFDLLEHCKREAMQGNLSVRGEVETVSREFKTAVFFCAAILGGGIFCLVFFVGLKLWLSLLIAGSLFLGIIALAYGMKKADTLSRQFEAGETPTTLYSMIAHTTPLYKGQQQKKDGDTSLNTPFLSKKFFGEEGALN